MNAKTVSRAATLAVALALIAWPLGNAAAADTNAVNPSGTWKVTTATGTAKDKAGTARTLKLKWEGGKLSGTLTKVSLVNGKPIVKERPIQDAKLQGTSISFSVTFPVEVGEGPDVTTRYQGKINGDTMSGKPEGVIDLAVERRVGQVPETQKLEHQPGAIVGVGALRLAAVGPCAAGKSRVRRAVL
jgi:hypothetical protein